ncbi:MAG: dihydroneopterin aldolase [Saprospiraceae bacterium]
MAWIALEHMQFYAHHGVYDAEQAIGGEFVVDVFIKTKISKSAGSDAVEDTLNYETVFQVCQQQMDKPRKLIETVLYGIVAGLKHQFGSMEGVRVRVRKLHPPLGGRVGSAWVEEEFDFTSECPRCKSKLVCYNDDDCWCRNVMVLPASRETIQRQYGKKCLCENCLKIYAG